MKGNTQQLPSVVLRVSHTWPVKNQTKSHVLIPSLRRLSILQENFRLQPWFSDAHLQNDMQALKKPFLFKSQATSYFSLKHQCIVRHAGDEKQKIDQKVDLW